jgi:hypothetical protein
MNRACLTRRREFDRFERHRALETGLAKLGYQGTDVSFDWPRGSLTLGSLEDRIDAKLTTVPW